MDYDYFPFDKDIFEILSIKTQFLVYLYLSES